MTVNHFLSDWKENVEIVVSNLHSFTALVMAENRSNLDFQILEVREPTK